MHSYHDPPAEARRHRRTWKGLWRTQRCTRKGRREEIDTKQHDTSAAVGLTGAVPLRNLDSFFEFFALQRKRLGRRNRLSYSVKNWKICCCMHMSCLNDRQWKR
jgi:hypothetical protein